MKILIIKIAAIGDVVMSLPMLTYLRDRYPEAHITWICGQQVAPLIRATDLVDRILEVDEKALLAGNLFSRLVALTAIWGKIAGRSFDLCITAHVDPRYRLLSLPARCKTRRSFCRKKGRISPIPGRYHAEEYIRLASEIDGPAAPPIAFPKLNLSFKRPLPNGTIVAIAPGGAKNVLANDALRRWPMDSYASLIKSLSSYPLHIIVTGGKQDEWVRDHLVDLSYIDWIGKLDLLELVAFLARAKLLITHDSGPLHLAKLAGCPTLALFGPTNPSEKVGRNENIKVLWGGEQLSCRPCYDGKTYAPCQRNDCLIGIRPHQVANEALQMLHLK